MKLQHFLTMGGYGYYVWLAYGLAALVLLYNLISAWRQHRNTLRKINAWLKQQRL